MKLTYRNGVFVPDEAVWLPEGHVIEVEVSPPRLTPEGNVPGSAAASRELVRELRRLPPIDAETAADFERILIDAGFSPPPERDTRFAKDGRVA